ncbi:MAG: MarR family transcriptional regulator [Acidobacteriota bacterium]
MAPPKRTPALSPEFQSLGQETALTLLRSADTVRRHFGAVLEPFGITLQQYNVLRILRKAGGDGLPTLTIVERMMEKTPGITRLLDRMERQDWVSRRRCTDDRRRVWISLTRKGRELLAQLDGPIDEADEEVVEALSDRQKEQVIRALRRLLSD